MDRLSRCASVSLGGVSSVVGAPHRKAMSHRHSILFVRLALDTIKTLDDMENQKL